MNLDAGEVVISFRQHKARLPLQAFDLLPVRVYVKDAEGKFVYANATCARELGCASPDEVVGKTDFHFFVESLAAAWSVQEQALLLDELQPIDQSEEEITTRNFRSWVRTAKFRITSAGGAPFGIVGVTRDISETRIQQSQYLHILNSVPSMVFAKEYHADEDTFRFTFANQALWQAIGHVDDSKIIGSDDIGVLGDTPEARSYKYIDADVLRTGKTRTREESFVDKDGVKRTLRTTKVPLRDPRRPEEAPIGVLGVATDITDLIAAQQQLREQSEVLSTLIEYMPAAFFIKDASGAFEVANAELARFVGVASPSEMLKKTDADFFPKEYCDETSCEEQAILQTGLPRPNVLRKTQIGNKEVIRLVSKVPLAGSDGKFTRILGVSQDITSLVEAQRQLRTHSAMLDMVLNSLPQKVFVKDRDGRYTLCNTSFSRHHGGLEPKDIVGKTDYDLWPTGQAHKYRSKDIEVLERRQPDTFLEEQVLPDGRQLTLETTKRPMYHPETGEPIGVLGVYDEFLPRASTARTRKTTFNLLCTQIRESSDLKRRYYLMLLGLTHVHGLQFNRCSLWSFDKDLLILRGLDAIGQNDRKSAAAVGPDVLGIEVEECVTLFDARQSTKDGDFIEFIQSQELRLTRHSCIHEGIEAACKSNKPTVTPLPTEESFADISEFVTGIEATEMLTVVIPLPGALTLVVFCDNVRSRTPIEYADLQATDEYCSLVQHALQEALERDLRRTQKAAEKVWQDVSWHVAHKLDSILPQTLVTLREAIQLLDAGGSIASVRKLLESLVDPAHRAAQLVGEFRGYANPAQVNPTDVCIIDELFHDFQKAFEFRHLTTELEIAGPVQAWTLLVDRKRIIECADLMAQNAGDLENPSLRVVIQIAEAKPADRFLLGKWMDRDNKWLKISISDNGPGVSPDFKKKIFEPGESRRAHGTGFGLAHVKRIIEAHGGSIIENGDEKEGARFLILLRAQPNSNNEGILP